MKDLGHEVINFGVFEDEETEISYIQTAVSMLLSSKTVDFVVTGCSSGQGMMLACNSLHDVKQRYVLEEFAEKIGLSKYNLLSLMTYPIENIIAEKYETTLDRGEYNTRMRDLFDIYLLMNVDSKPVDHDLLAKTIIKVSEDRDTLENLDDFDEIIEMLETSEIFNINFLRYKVKQYPDLDISLREIIDQFKAINQKIKIYRYTA